jgi:hypothetical protein
VKFRLLFIIILIASDLYSQHSMETYASFAIDHKEVAWIQIYHQDESSENLSAQVFDFLKRKAWIKNLEYDGPEIIADLQNFRVDYKRYGGKFMNTSSLIRSGRWSGKLRVSFKDGKYRVVVYGLQYDAHQPTINTGKVSNESHMIHGTWSDWVLNNYRSAFKKRRHKNMDFMHFSLKDSFTIRETEVIDNKW